MSLPPTSFLDGLATALGPRSVRFEEPDADAVDAPVGDVAVVRPSTTEEVADVVRACATAGIAIVARGGNTGLSFGALTPVDRPAIVLSLDRLDQILSIDANRWTMTAQAGVTVQALQEAAASVDRKFAPDWGARGTATIGGAIATDAGGNNVVRYGNLRDNIMGLEVVLADGQIWDGRRSLRKDSSGYDLKQLFIGGEGTLGVVTSAVVKLVPATSHEQSALAAITDLDDLMPLLALAHEHAPALLTAFELVPDVGIERVEEVYGLSRAMATRAEYYVLVKLASAEPVTDQLTAFLAAGAEADHITDAVVAGTAEQEAALWMLRDELPPMRIHAEYTGYGLKLDAAVPIDQIATFVRAVHERAARIAPMAHCYGFGHVGDGNIHMMILPTNDEAIAPWLAVKGDLEDAIDELVFDLDGTLSAEHGLGLLLRDRVEPQKQPIEWTMMRAVKAALDPDDLFNPGKMIPLQ